MQLLWWLITIVLFAVGLIGSVLPIVPGTTIIGAAVVIHRVMLGSGKSVSWWIVSLVISLVLASYAIEFAAGYLGAKRFGATKWGAWGAAAGGIAGLFFGLPGLVFGPILGAVGFEFFNGRRMVAAGKAGWGTLLGNIAGMIAKLLIAFAIIALFLANVPPPF